MVFLLFLYQIILGGINMVEINEANMIERMIYSINDFKDEMVKSMNYIREDIHDLKGEVGNLRQELRDYKEENNKRWEENEKRWEENERRWKENTKCWEEYRENRKNDKKALLDILTNYDISISEQLGDPNAEKMRQIV